MLRGCREPLPILLRCHERTNRTQRRAQLWRHLAAHTSWNYFKLHEENKSLKDGMKRYTRKRPGEGSGCGISKSPDQRERPDIWCRVTQVWVSVSIVEGINAKVAVGL